MASVWVARQRGKHGFEKLVALKTILPKFAADVRFQEMFLDEARIASRIEHLNVAQIFDLGEEHEVLYLAMEYVDGDSLSKLNRACQRGGIKIPPNILLRVLADTCAGLHEAHELKDATGRPLEIVHRDVSPHNILVSTKGIAKLIDFGIAKARFGQCRLRHELRSPQRQDSLHGAGAGAGSRRSTSRADASGLSGRSSTTSSRVNRRTRGTTSSRHCTCSAPDAPLSPCPPACTLPSPASYVEER